MPYVQSGTPQKDFTGKGVIDVYNSPNVYANFVNIALWQNPQGAEVAVMQAINSPSYAAEAQVIELDGEEDETIVTQKQAELVTAGVITQEDLNKGKTAGANPAAEDTTPKVAEDGTDPGAATVGSEVDATILWDGPFNSALPTKITVATVTKVPGVVFPYDVATIAPQNGMTAQEVCDNLKALVTNVWVPLKTQYSDAFMTCSFRKGSSNPTSQHPKGMACDIQYKGISKSEYYVRAQWIRDNIKFDQFLLEYKTTGTGLPWHHLSYNKAGSNRGQVFTFMNDKNCKGPGVVGLFDLANA
jgi:hypothetical protein